MQNNKDWEFLQQYLQKPRHERRICVQCHRDLAFDESSSLCAICSRIKNYNLQKQGKRRNPELEKTDAGYILRISSNFTNDTFARHKDFLGVQYSRSSVIGLNTAKILSTCQKEGADIAKVTAFVISHEVFHWILKEDHSEIVSVLFDAPFIKDVISSYLGGNCCFKHYRDDMDKMKNEVKFALVKKYHKQLGIK